MLSAVQQSILTVMADSHCGHFSPTGGPLMNLKFSIVAPLAVVFSTTRPNGCS
jgi:hypothetical protein